MRRRKARQPAVIERVQVAAHIRVVHAVFRPQEILARRQQGNANRREQDGRHQVRALPVVLRRVEAVELANLSVVENKEGNLQQAEANLTQAIRISRQLNNSYILAASLVALSGVSLSSGRAQQAARLLGRADAIYSTTGLVMDPADKPEYDTALAGARSGLGQEAFAAAYAEGAGLSIEELTELR